MANKEQIATKADEDTLSSESTPKDFEDRLRISPAVGDLNARRMDMLASAENQKRRQQTLLEQQRSRGNYYVQLAVIDYQKRHQAAKKDGGSSAVATPKPGFAQPSPRQMTGTPNFTGPPIVTAPPIVTTPAIVPKVPDSKTSSLATLGKGIEQKADLPAPLPVALPGHRPVTTPRSTGGAPSSGQGVYSGGGLQDWKAGVRGATASLSQAKIDAAPQVGHVKASGTAAVKGQQKKTETLRADGKAAMPAPPKVEGTPPLVPQRTDPVPAATELLTMASNKLLPPQVFPAPETSPQNVTPTFEQAPPASATAPDAAKDVHADKDAPATAKDPNKANEDTANAPVKEPKGPAHKGPGGEIIIDDANAPKVVPTEAPPFFKGGMTQALARLMADPGAEAQAILNAIRANAYSGELAVRYPQIGDSSLADLKTSLSSEWDGIRQEAGISEEEMHLAVTKRQQEIQTESEEAQGQVCEAGREQTEQVSVAGTDALSIIAGTREELDLATEDKLAQAKGENDPEVLKLTRERLIRDAQKKVAQQVVAYEEAGTKRKKEIAQVAALQRLAYRNAVTEDEKSINGRTPAGASGFPYDIMLANSRNWGDAETRKLEQMVVDQDNLADVLAGSLKTDIRTAGSQAAEMIRTWADAKLNEHRGFWARIWQMFSDWSAQSKAESEAWQAERNKATRDAMVGDMKLLGSVVMLSGEELSEQARAAMEKLNAEQRAILSTYYGLGPDGHPMANAKDAHNPIAAIAAGLRTRIQAERAPDILKEFETELAAVPKGDWSRLDALGKKQNGSFDAQHVCSEVHEALHGGVFGWNDEPRVFRALAGLTRVQSLAAHKLYCSGYGKDLDDDIHSQLSGAEQTRAEALLAGDQTVADVATLREAMHGGITGWGTDEKAIMETLRGKSAEERAKIKEKYFELYNVRLEDDIKSELTGLFEDEHDYQRAQALMEGDRDKADAIAIDQAMYGGLTGWGTDRKGIEDIYAQVRTETEKEVAEEHSRTGKPPLTTKELEAEVKRRSEQIEASYDSTYANKWDDKSKSALRQSYEDELSGGELSLIDALADNDQTKADASRIQIEHESFFYADDDIINGVLKHQYERSLEETKRDQGPALQEALRKKKQDALNRGERWDPYRDRQEQHALQRELEKRARAQGFNYMDSLEHTFDKDFSKFGHGGLHYIINSDTDGVERWEANRLMKQGGYLTPAQQIFYSTEMLGTKDKSLSAAVEGRTKEEIVEIRKEWALSHPHESLEDRIDAETSGRLNFELHQKLKGEPMTMDEEMEATKDLVEHENEHTSTVWASDENARMNQRYAEMKQRYAAANVLGLSDDEQAKRIAEFQHFAGYTKTTTEEHSESVKAVTDTLVTAVTTAIAVVVAAAVIFFSGGTATPAVVAALASWWGAAGVALATAVVGIGIRQAMLGSDYGIEDMGVDLAVGGVDAVAAAATLGLSKVAMTSVAERFVESLGKEFSVAERTALIEALEQDPRFAKNAFQSMAQSSSRLPRMAAHGAFGAVSGALAAAPSGATRSILDGSTWEGGGAWEKIFSGTTDAMKSGAGGGLLMGALGAAKTPHAPDLHRVGGEAPVRSADQIDRLPPGSQHTEASLKEALPPDLREKIPITIDPDLKTDTVRVHYEVDDNGAFKDIHIRTGPKATPRDIELHVATVRTMQKYVGLQGRARVLLAKARAWIRSGTTASVHRMIEARAEVQKLQGHIDDSIAKLAEPDLDPHVRAELDKDLAHYKDQFEENRSILEGLKPPDDARGYVAAEGRDETSAVDGSAPGDEAVTAKIVDPANPSAAGAGKEDALAGGTAGQQQVATPQVQAQPPGSASPAGPAATLAPDPREVMELRARKAALKREINGKLEVAAEKSALAKAAAARADDFEASVSDLEGEPHRTPEQERLLKLNRNQMRKETQLAEYWKLEETKPLAEVEALRKKIEPIDAKLDSYKNAAPWRSLHLRTAKPEELGLYGELETTSRLITEGLQPVGKTIRPGPIITPADFYAQVKAYHGKTGPDGLYKRVNPVTGKKEFWCGEVKTTAGENVGAPTGKGELKKTIGSGFQMSDTWIAERIGRSGLTPEDEKGFREALTRKTLRKFYAQTTDSGTRFFELNNGSKTGVVIGAEIKKF